MKKLNIPQTDDGKLGEILDEILSKMGRGEEPDIDDYTRQHPDAGEILKHALPAIRAVADSIGGSDAAVDNHVSISPKKALGDFRIVRELGRGGMGVVYEADQISLGRKVALKVLPFAGMIRENALQRFHNEVRAAAALNHPNIVSVYSIGEERGVHYYAMQLIQGRTLADVIAQLVVLRRSKTPVTGESLSHAICGYDPSAGSSATDPTEQHSQPPENVPPPSTQRAIQANVDTLVTTGHDRQFYHSIAGLGIQAADALQHAHDNGVLHRDIKPGNLMLDSESQLYITDFGLARIETDAAMTMTGDLIGTLRYMSPEQALAKRVVIDHRSDIYSLGATLYEAMTLTPVFVAEDRQELLKQIAFEEPAKLRSVDRSIPGELETIIHKAIAKNPDERYATAEELADDLRAFQQNRPIKAKPPTMLQRSGKWAQRHQGVVVAEAYYRVGEVQLVLGNRSEAEAAHQRSLDLRMALAKEYPRDANAQHALAKSHLAIGHFRTYAYADLITELEYAIELTKSLESPEHRATLGEAYTALGGIKVRHFKNDGGLEKMEEARIALEMAVSILEELCSKNPDTRWQIALTGVYTSLGGWHKVMGHKDEDKLLHRKSLEITKRLAEQDPDNLKFQEKLADSHWNVGECEKCIEIYKRLTERNPSVVRFKKRLADAYAGHGYDTKSPDMLQQSIEISRRLASDYPDNASFLGRVGATYQSLGDVFASLGQNEQSIVAYESAVESLTERGMFLGELIDAYRGLTKAHDEAGNLDQAVVAQRKACRTNQEILNRSPKGLRWRTNAAYNQQDLGALLGRKGNHEEEVVAVRKAIEHLQIAIEPVEPVNRLPNELGKAQRLLRQLHQQLGATLYRIGRWQKAVESLEQAELLQGDDLDHRMFLAMAHWQLGHKERAKELYTQGAAWIDVEKRNSKEQQQFRTEAEELMGLTGEDRNQLIAGFYSNAKRQDAWFFTARGTWHQDRGEHQRALEDFRRAEQNKSSDLLQLTKRRIILILVRQNRLQEVIAELPSIDELDSSSDFLRAASVLAYAGEKPLYRKLCERMLEKFADSAAISDVEQTCKVCSILPGVIEPSTLPLTALETGLKEQNISSKYRCWFTLAQAMSRYRLGDTEQALAAIRETQAHESYSQTPAAQALTLTVMAMCEHKSGRLENAKQALDRATPLIEESWPKMLNDEFDNGWLDWLIAETLRSEAAALLSAEAL